MDRHLFLGGNTSEGFFSFYNEAFSRSSDEHLYILKGGSGVGKSSFMKTVAGHYSKKGIAVEYYHCSSDPDSLDGIYLKELKVGILDGTSPHIVDPKLPIAFDEIIDLANFIDKRKISKEREKIFKLIEEKQRLYAAAYNLLKAAFSVQRSGDELIVTHADNVRRDRIINQITDGLKSKDTHFSPRMAFACAYTSKGFISYADSLFKDTKIIALRGSAVISRKILAQIENHLNLKGLPHQNFYCPLFPREIEHIIVDDYSLSFVTLDECAGANIVPYETIDISSIDCLDEHCAGFLRENSLIVDNILNEFYAMLKRCADIHENIEEFYIDSMDFNEVDQKIDSTIASIEKYARGVFTLTENFSL